MKTFNLILLIMVLGLAFLTIATNGGFECSGALSFFYGLDWKAIIIAILCAVCAYLLYTIRELKLTILVILSRIKTSYDESQKEIENLKKDISK